MASVLFVNISDIHLRETNKINVLLKLSVFVKTLDSLKKIGDYKKIVLLVSGDLAYSGKQSEYESLNEIFEELATSYDLIMCPGNHDHDFGAYPQAEMRNHLLKMSPELQSELSIQTVTHGLENYRNFEKKFETIPVLNKTELAKSYTIKNDLEDINISVLNTAWCSQIREKGGDIYFPSQFLPKVSKGSFNILFMHHPLSWFEPNNQKEIRNLIREDFSIILSGHEHLSDNFNVISENSNCLMIEAMPMDDPGVDVNGFTTFEAINSDIVIKNYHWQGKSFEEQRVIKKSDILKGNSISTSTFTVKLEFYKGLLDVGVSFIHPDKELIDLNDVFVYPNLKSISEQDKLDMKKISSESIIKNSKKRILLIGDEYCGKTTLMKKYFIDGVKMNYHPLLIEGVAVRNGGVEFDKIINRHVLKQYDGINSFDYISSEVNKVLLLDGFDFVKGDRKSIDVFLTKANNIFEKIIITVSDTFDFGASELVGGAYFGDDYYKYEISKLGHKLRYELINKWNLLKEVNNEEKSGLVYNNNFAVKTITKVLGRNYIPSTPFFLLTLLQSMETGNTLEVSSNTYGYYYQYLITQNLGKSDVNKDELDELFNYIMLLSNHYFSNNLIDDSKNNLFNFNLFFCSEYGVQIDFDTRFELLKKSKIIEEKDGYYKFKYPYVYYFFIAKHLSETINQQQTIKTIDNLIQTLNKRRSMSILMFLTHHSRDESILNKVVIQAQSLFSKSTPTKMEVDADFVNRLIDKLPSLPVIYEQKNRIEYRLQHEERKDFDDENQSATLESVLNSDEEEGTVVTKSSDREIIDANDFFKETNLTFKSLEVLGQISKNYYGSLKVNQKKKILSEAIRAPLRTLDYYFSLISNNSDAAIDLVEKRLLDKFEGKIDSASSSDVKETARRFFFEMVFGLSLFFITKISSSIGSANLQVLIDEVCDEIGSNSGRLIKLATLLEMGSSISIDELRRLISNMEKNHLSDRLLKSIIVNYLYMFERSDSETQQICHIAGINYNSISKQIGFNKMI